MGLTLGVDFSSGTSIAAPHVTGSIALLMQTARDLLPIEQTRDLVINNSPKNPPPSNNAWDSCFGVGRISASAAIRPFAADPETLLFELTRNEVLISEVTSTSITLKD